MVRKGHAKGSGFWKVQTFRYNVSNYYFYFRVIAFVN